MQGEIGKINDRGIKKWQGLMITEHLELIKEMDREMALEKPKELSVWELEDLQQTVNQALQQNAIITLNVWEEDRYTKYEGIIRKISNNTLTLESSRMKHIPIKNIHKASTGENFD